MLEIIAMSNPTEKLEQKELQSELDEIMLMIRVNRNSEVGKMKHRNIRYAIQTLINSEVASAVNGTLDRLEKKAETYHHNYTLNPRGHVITEAIPLEAINDQRKALRGVK